MDFPAFIQECKDDVERFEAHWRLMHQQQPKNYPMKMNPGDWYDQFLAFLALGGKEGTQ